MSTTTVQVVRTGNQADRVYEFDQNSGDNPYADALCFAAHQAERETVILVRVIDGGGVLTLTHKQY